MDWFLELEHSLQVSGYRFVKLFIKKSQEDLKWEKEKAKKMIEEVQNEIIGESIEDSELFPIKFS